MGTGYFVHHRIVSAVKRVEFVSDRKSSVVLRGRLCNIIISNVHAPSEEKSDDSNDSFYEELEQVFDHFPKCHMKSLIKENIKISSKESLSLYEVKKHKPWFHKECSCFLDKRKQAKMEWLQDPNQSNVDNLNNVRHEASRHFRNKKKEYLIAK